MELNLLRKDLIEPREYQLKIAETASRKNTLVVLPTGTGKSLISLLVGLNRLEKFPNSKILITSPTRPLNAQHKKTFENFSNIVSENIVLVTGKIKPEERKKLYEIGKIIIGTPQCFQNDLENERLNLENFSFITFDEAHRAVKDYSYTFIAKKYVEQAKNPLILALTASPGGSFERIEEIKKNLFIEAVEIRSELDEDMKKYVQPISKDWVYVELPEEFEKIKVLLEEKLKENLFWLRDHNLLQTLRPSKKSLLMLQEKFSLKMMEGSRNYSFMWAVIKVAEAIKIEHALELLETQGISPLLDFFKKIEASDRKSDKQLMKDPRIREAIKITNELYLKGVEHPKIEKLLFIVKDLLRENASNRIIIFANYRSTIDKINEIMRKNGIKSEILIGQAIKKGKGLTQKQQIEILKRFNQGLINMLAASSIGEEGIDYYADVAIFYDAVPSEIRNLQRKGRVGRKKAGKVIFLLTKNSRDESYYWAAFHRERKMKGILYDMKERSKIKRTLKDWLKT
ncbi:MAG: helicase-related protein [Candidatus Aenigmatarchaeota archaeon]